MAAGGGGAGPGWSLGNQGPGRLTRGQRGSPRVRVGPAARRCAGARQVRWHRGAGGELPVLAGGAGGGSGLLPGCPLHLALLVCTPGASQAALGLWVGPHPLPAYSTSRVCSPPGVVLNRHLAGDLCLPLPGGCLAPWAGAGEGSSRVCLCGSLVGPGAVGHQHSYLLLPNHLPSSPEGLERSRRWPRALTARQGCAELAGESGQGPGVEGVGSGPRGRMGAGSWVCSGRGAASLWSPGA